MNVTMRGEELLATLRREARAGRPVAATLRHAERHAITDPARPELPELTPGGHAMAEEFGAELTGFACVRLFHSPVLRCQQTAESIARGVRRIGGRAELCGAQEPLGIGYTRDRYEFGRLFELHGEHFVRLWCDDALPPHVLDSATACSAQIVDYIRRRLEEHAAGVGALDLHVSHDINIMAVREKTLGVRHEEAGWLGFLDGVTLSAGERGLRVAFRDQVREIS